MAHKKQTEEKNEELKEEKFNMDEQCDCDDDCCCNESCNDDCCCDDECHCHDEEKNYKDLADEYLTMAKIVQADFDNYRKRSIESITKAKQDGTISAVECILPCIDVFKTAKTMINDESSLKGILMIENEMLESLKKLGVKKIETKDAMFDPNFHNALSIIENKDLKDGQIIEEYKAGYMLGDRVIRYSQVIVNKIKEEN